MIRYLHGDVVQTLDGVPAGSVHCVVTSPPYWSQRAYLDGDHALKSLEIGNEPTPGEYVDKLVRAFAAVGRVMRDDATLWVNIGDTYASDTKWGGRSDRPFPRRDARGESGMKDGDLIGIPWLFAFAMRSFGWYVRQEIIWHKPNPMTESAPDRCNKAHEQLFLFTKSRRYYFDPLAIAESTVDGTGTRQKRSVWTVPVAGFKGAHFAVFPRKLIDPCIRAGTSAHGVCAWCGAPYRRIVEKERHATRPGVHSKAHEGGRMMNGAIVGKRDPLRHVTIKRTVGWRATCACPPAIGRPTVLDPFAGSGTTAEAAAAAGCHAVLVDLHPEYIVMQKQRMANVEAAK